MRLISTCLAATMCMLSMGSADSTKPYLLKLPLGLIEPDIPRSNPLTAEKIALGKRLFFDMRLSRSGATSCATCHNPHNGFAESRPVSRSDDGGPQTRNAPTILNTGFMTTLMWDGRFRTLEEQVIDSFRPEGDMGRTIGDALEVVAENPVYVRSFESAFGGPPTVRYFTEAIASFERSLLAGATRFDEYLFGGRDDALTPKEKHGYEVFVTRGACINCHDIFHPSLNPLGGGVALFSDFRFHNLGVGYRDGRMTDSGRFYTTRVAEDWGTFRTPTLRNVALTAPYMHDGTLQTLREVVDFYDRGGTPNPNLSPSIRPLLLTDDEKESLVAFLETLTDELYATLSRQPGTKVPGSTHPEKAMIDE